MKEPQDLPGRFGRVVKSLDRVLAAIGAEAVLAGGWAVWRHGFDGRITHDVDIGIAAKDIDEFIRVAAVSGFTILDMPEGCWPKIVHRDTGIEIDLLAEGARPGREPNLAPTTIPAPTAMGATGTALVYIRLTSLVELKIAAGRNKDISDLTELIRANSDRLQEIRQHLSSVHPSYVETFDRLQHDAARNERLGKPQ